jgi:hypothetical protein
MPFVYLVQRNEVYIMNGSDDLRAATAYTLCAIDEREDRDHSPSGRSVTTPGIVSPRGEGGLQGALWRAPFGSSNSQIAASFLRPAKPPIAGGAAKRERPVSVPMRSEVKCGRLN